MADDFGDRLISLGMPEDVTADFVKRGVWSHGDGRSDYGMLLDEYNAPDEIREYFDTAKHLWEASPCISRIHTAAEKGMVIIMDIFSFINSKDIRKYLREIRYSFTSLEAAWLIWQCRSASFEEKHGAWRELIDTMPDCTIGERPNTDPRDSLHRFLEKYMAMERQWYDEVRRDDPRAVYRYSVYLTELGEWCDGAGVYSSFGSCMNKIKEMSLDPETEPLCTITKEYLDAPGNNVYITISHDGTVMSVDMAHIDDAEQYSLRERSFSGLWFSFPVPFNKGDILWDPYNHSPIGFCDGPFVMKGITPQEYEKSGREGCDASDMNAWGYFLDEEKCQLYSEVMSNYMDLEYYPRDLTHKKRLLKLMQNYLRDDTVDEVFLVQAYHQIVLEEYERCHFPYSYREQSLLDIAGLRHPDKKAAE